jgi:hypothetical protein
MYNTYGNVRSGADLIITCIMTQLEKRFEKYGHLPKTIYIQIDGGSENSNKFVLALCEFLIASKLTDHIYLSRLPVGHTHEGIFLSAIVLVISLLFQDIDAKFGKLWTYFRKGLVASPTQLRKILSDCFGRKGLPFEQVDVFIVPDWKKVFDDNILDNFEKYVF